jgi:hypothetical protein
MPSAPITTSAVAVVPSAKPTVARTASWLKPVHRHPGAHRARRQLPGQQRKQVGPVDPDVLSGQGKLIRLVPHDPPVGEPQLRRHVPGAHPPDPLADPEPLQHPQTVRRQRHPRADLGQLLRLLIHPDVDPSPHQRNRRSDPADPAAGNHRPQRHALPLSERPAP